MRHPVHFSIADDNRRQAVDGGGSGDGDVVADASECAGDVHRAHQGVVAVRVAHGQFGEVDGIGGFGENLFKIIQFIVRLR